MFEATRERLAHRVGPGGGLAVAVVAVSTSAILVRYSDAPKPIMAFYRVLFTGLLLLPFAGGVRPALARISRRDALAAVAAGVALAAHFVAWFEAVDRTTVAAAVTLVQTQAVFVAVGAALLLDERLSRRALGGIGLAVLGGATMAAGEASGSPAPAPLLGNALAVVGAAMAAGYVLAGRSLRQRIDLLPYVLVVYGTCTLTLLVAVLAAGLPLGGYPGEEWLLFLAMAVGPGVFGHTLINWALGHLESGVVAVALVGEPVGSTFLALVLLAEVPAVATVFGGAAVLAGIAVTSRASDA